MCPGYDGSDQVEVLPCVMDICPSGEAMVYEVTDNARQLGLIDNLFLNRYSQVTDLKSKFCFEVYSNEII